MSQRRTVLIATLAWPLFARAAAAQNHAAGAASVLAVGGRASARTFDMAALERLPQRTITTATPWYPNTRRFTGPLLREVLAAAGMPADATGVVRCVALNDYKVDIPLDDVRRYDVVLARELDGQPMSVRDKGPLFVIYPFDERPELRTSLYYGRCIWQLKSIDWI